MSAKVRLPRVAVFENGEIRDVSFGESGNDVVLALPLSRLILKVVRVPKDQDAIQFATPILNSLSPFPDEPLTVSCEVVRETERGTVVVAAALPESVTDDLAEALDAKKLNVTRVDSLALGQLRQSWSQIAATNDKRRLVKIKSPGAVALIVLDGDQPLSIRSVSDEAELQRETMLSLLEAEDFGGPRELGDTIEIEANDAALEGVALRSTDPDALNALPESWAGVLAETRFKAKLLFRVAIAVAFWVLVMGVLFGVPIAFGYLTDHQKGLSKAHARQYREVKEMKAKVDLVHKYSDHARGALEIMKAVASQLPPSGGITLTSWTFKRDEGVRLSGEADQASEVYDFKNKTEELAYEGADGEKVFPNVILKGPSATKTKQRFDLELLYKTEETEE